MTTVDAVHQTAQLTNADDLFEEIRRANELIGEQPLIDSLREFSRLAIVATHRVQLLEAQR